MGYQRSRFSQRFADKLPKSERTCKGMQARDLRVGPAELRRKLTKLRRPEQAPRVEKVESRKETIIDLVNYVTRVCGVKVEFGETPQQAMARFAVELCPVVEHRAAEPEIDLTSQQSSPSLVD